MLRERGLSPKKSFGQNFLQDPRIAERIADLASGGCASGTVLEIGAGAGALTMPLAQRFARVIAVERDRDLVPLLGEMFADMPHVSVLEADAAQLDWPELLGRGDRPRVVAGNLPYHLTGRLIEMAVHAARHIDRAVLMVQRELADRLAARPATGDYGALTVFTQAAFAIEVAVRVSPGAFFPAPRVDSAVVVLTPLDPPRADETDTFRELVRRAFGQRRKMLKRAWKGVFGWSDDDLRRNASAAGIDLDARGETLTIEQFAALARLDDED
jgi:16S rRNA (adenine1518-N6/adenine1519-N6)-dimethyltransferase